MPTAVRVRRVFAVSAAAVVASILMAGCGSDRPAARETAAHGAEAAAWKTTLTELAKAQEVFYERYGTFTASWDDLHAVSAAPAATTTSDGRLVDERDPLLPRSRLRTVAGGQSYRAEINGDFGTLEVLRDPTGTVRFPRADLLRRSARWAPARSRGGPTRRATSRACRKRVIVPLADGNVVAIAPYVGYKGFFVKRPSWQGVYVYHPDCRLEDLSPQEAMARPEAATTGRLFPEALARDLAEAYGYQHGVRNAIPGGEHRAQTQISTRPATRSRT